jgi:hypothetical protein
MQQQQLKVARRQRVGSRAGSREQHKLWRRLLALAAAGYRLLQLEDDERGELERESTPLEQLAGRLVGPVRA